MRNERVRKVFIILFWIVVWQIIAIAIDNQIALVGPVEMIRALFHDVLSYSFWLTACSSLLRIGAGFLLAFTAGILAGILSYRYRTFGEFIQPVMTLIKTVPVAAFIILALIIIGSSYLSLLISFIIVIPMIYQATVSGLMSTDRNLIEMADVFHMKKTRRCRYIYRPFLMPYLLSATKTALGMSWKSGIAAEVIGTPENSIGGAMYLAKVYLATDELFAWTFTVILMSIAFESIFMKLLGRFSDD